MTSFEMLPKSTKYSEGIYDHIVDERGPAQRIADHELTESNTLRNLKALKVEMTEKQKVSYTPSIPRKIDFEDGWYVWITDSNAKEDGDKPEKEKKKKANDLMTILTLHGAPGDHREWAGLEFQMSGSCRWINLTIPGFDNQDERRGTYQGTAEDLSKLIIRVITHLGIARIIYCGHSLGSIFGTYFITYHPQYVAGYINITGIVNLWYTGLLTFFRRSVELGYQGEEWRKSGFVNQDQWRDQAYRRFIDRAQDTFFGPVEFPKLTKTEYFGYLKLINSFPNGVSQLYHLNSELKVFQFLIFGKKDPLHEHHKTEQCISHFIRYNNKINRKTANEAVKVIKNKFDITLDEENLQSYFCFHFDDTGHNAHKRRPKQISRILKIYIEIVKVLQKDRDSQALPKL